MSFTLFQKPPKLGRPEGLEPRVTMFRSTKTGTHVALNKPLLATLKWIKGDRVEVLVGTGDDAGVIALRRAAQGYKLTMDGGSSRCKIGATYLLPGHAVSATPCAYQIIGDTVYITVPAAFLNTGKRGFAANARTASMVAA